MKAGMFAATLLLFATAVHAQDAPAYRLSGGLMAGGVPAPFKSRICGDRDPALGAQIGVARRLLANLDVVATGSVLDKVARDTCIVLLEPRGPGIYVDPVYGENISKDPMISTDLRARVHSNGSISAELAAGAGYGFVQNVPYGVVAGGFRFGRNLQIGIGGEVRSYRIPYDLSVTVIPESGAVQTSKQDGAHVWRRAEFITLFGSLPLGGRRTS